MSPKRILKSFIIYFICFVLAWQYLPGVVLSGNFEVLFIVSAIYTILNLILKPLLKIIMLPINIFTLGIFGWIVCVILFVLTTLYVDGFEVVEFLFTGINTSYGEIKEFQVSKFFSYICSSFFIVFTQRILRFILK